MASRYWVGGANTWNATAGTKWATTSGGAGGAAVPTSADDVFFDAASTGTITLAAGNVCKNFDCTGFTGTVSFPTGATLDVFGLVFKISSAMTWSLGSSTAILTFKATTGTCLITLAGKTMGTMTFDGVGGTWQYQDAVTTAASRAITLTNGTLDLNGQTLTMGGQFSSSNSNARELKAAGATMSIGTTGTVWNVGVATNFTMTGFATFTINITNTSSLTKTLVGGGTTKIGTVNVPPDPAPGNSTGTVGFNAASIEVLNVTGPKYILMSTTAKAIGKLNFAGSAGNPVTVLSGTPGTKSVLTQTARGNATYTTITDIEVRGPTLFLDRNSSNGGNIAGMMFNNAGTGLSPIAV